MATITNWAQVGASAHKGDMDRAELQLAQRRQAQSEQAQRFGQQRAQALDAEERRRYDQRRADAQADKAYARGQAERQYADAQADKAYARGMAERQYQDERADKAYMRGRQERQYQDERADKAYMRGRQERLDANTEAIQQWTMDRQAAADARAAEGEAFDRMLRTDEAARRQALWERQDAEYKKLQQQEDERRAALEAGFATLLSNGIARGHDDGRGNILVPPQYIETFNKMNGTNLSGLVLATRGADGKPLPVPQILTLEPQMGRDGKPLTDPTTGQTVTQMAVMPMVQVQAMFQAFPGVPEAMERALPEQSRLWMQTLGFGGQATGAGEATGAGGMDAKDRMSYEKWAYEQDAKDYRALAGAPLPNPEGMGAVSKRMEERRKRMDALAGGQAVPQASTEGAQGAEQPKEKKFSFVASPSALNAL